MAQRYTSDHGGTRASANAAISARGWGLFRPDGHKYVLGRDKSPIEPGGPIGRFLENNAPAGHTFAVSHDNFVGEARAAGAPDWLVNFPSMLILYRQALMQENGNAAAQLLNEYFGTNLEVVEHVDPAE
jgi:hypothetical protein